MRRGPRVVRILVPALLLMLAACEPASRPDATAAAEPPALCRVGPDGLPLPGTEGFADATRIELAERGIGGTGGGTVLAPRPLPGPLAQPAGSPPAGMGRGIGGTGSSGGGLGVIGVITGFGSVCLAGQEIGLGDAPVTADGAASAPAVLRAGQLAVLTATARQGAAEGAPALGAAQIDIRHEVSGPVEQVRPDGRLVVAGQLVRVSSRTWQPAALPAPHPGQWLAVSGLREPSGEIDATRLDSRAPGPVLVRGLLRRDGGPARIGTMPLEAAAPDEALRNAGLAALPADMAVVASGGYASGVLLVDRIGPDPVAANPVAFFAGLPEAPAHLLIEDDLAAARDGLLVPGGGLFGPERSASGGEGAPTRAVVGYALRGTRYMPTGVALPAPGPARPFSLQGAGGARFVPAPLAGRPEAGPHPGGGRNGRGDAGRGGEGRGAEGRNLGHRFGGADPLPGPHGLEDGRAGALPSGMTPGSFMGPPGGAPGAMPMPHGRLP